MDLKKYIRSIPDYPKKGILFRDITTLIKNPDSFNFAIDKIVDISKKIKFDKIPVITGVWELMDDWIIPEGVHSNVEFVQEKLELDSDLPEDVIYLLCDPQTSGGLLISVPKAKTDELLKTLTDANVETVALVGEIIEDKENRIYVV